MQEVCKYDEARRRYITHVTRNIKYVSLLDEHCTGFFLNLRRIRLVRCFRLRGGTASAILIANVKASVSHPRICQARRGTSLSGNQVRARLARAAVSSPSRRLGQASGFAGSNRQISHSSSSEDVSGSEESHQRADEETLGGKTAGEEGVDSNQSSREVGARARVRWRTRQSGFHFLRPIIKLADGTWLVGDYAEGPSSDYRVTEFSFSDIRWKYLNIDYVVTARTDAWVVNPDLSKVDEIGFTDLMPGSPDNHGHGAASTSRVDWIEIYAPKVPRSKAAETNNNR
jgi:hypothetical protein